MGTKSLLNRAKTNDFDAFSCCFEAKSDALNLVTSSPRSLHGPYGLDEDKMRLGGGVIPWPIDSDARAPSVFEE
jgi:hypothetical protein